ncbi:hypothetical protein D3C79_49420 [compost metagenome]
MSKDKVNDRLGASDVYQPANDEPCVFTGNHRYPVSSAWMLWYIRKNPRATIAVAQAAGMAVIHELLHELRRVIDYPEPVKVIDTALGKSLSLAWMVWYSNTEGCPYSYTRWKGQTESIDHLKL